MMSYSKDIKEHLTPEDHAQKGRMTTVSIASSATLIGGAAFDFLELVSEEVLSYCGVGLFGTVGFLAMKIFISAERHSLGMD